MERDFTHVKDLVEGIVRLLQACQSVQKKYQLFNIGNGTPVNLFEYIINHWKTYRLKGKIDVSSSAIW